VKDGGTITACGLGSWGLLQGEWSDTSGSASGSIDNDSNRVDGNGYEEEGVERLKI